MFIVNYESCGNIEEVHIVFGKSNVIDFLGNLIYLKLEIFFVLFIFCLL